MEPYETLNIHLQTIINNESFMTDYCNRVRRENASYIPIWKPIEVFAHMASDIDPLRAMASLLVDLEEPTPFLLIDILENYIKMDPRFDHLRRTLPHVVCKKSKFEIR